MGANISTEYEANGSTMNKDLVVTCNGSSAKNDRNIVLNGSSSASKGRVLAFHSSSKWKIHFEASKLTSNLMVVDFKASWCGPSRSMEPAMNEFSAKYTDVHFIKIDVDELEDVAKDFGIQIMPTFILIKKGEEVDKLVGANKEELRKKIEKYRAQ
ncbi:thioredoxin H2-like [Olea europaea subsp. europaea]|uniref:Thioredoxin H2-like n=1 Tax=Olea europaea subsp. europaea TaxID=158383 RepID=A0A8S0QTB0_OLEEU|nr:thioredoxin H2-like [Olea europaea subsp. europaea]